MTQENPKVGIDPATIATQMAVGKDSRSGIPRKRFAITATGTNGDQYIQLGTLNQIGQFSRLQRQADDGDKPSIRGAFAEQDCFVGEHTYEGLRQATFSEVSRSLVDGDKLVEGPQAIPARPGEDPTADIPGKAVWAPSSLALGKEWIIKPIPKL